MASFYYKSKFPAIFVMQICVTQERFYTKEKILNTIACPKAFWITSSCKCPISKKWLILLAVTVQWFTSNSKLTPAVVPTRRTCPARTRDWWRSTDWRKGATCSSWRWLTTEAWLTRTLWLWTSRKVRETHTHAYISVTSHQSGAVFVLPCMLNPFTALSLCPQ